MIKFVEIVADSVVESIVESVVASRGVSSVSGRVELCDSMFINGRASSRVSRSIGVIIIGIWEEELEQYQEKRLSGNLKKIGEFEDCRTKKRLNGNLKKLRLAADHWCWCQCVGVLLILE